MSLDDLTYRDGRMEYRSLHLTEPESALDDHLVEARQILDAVAADLDLCCSEEPAMSENFQSLRWFPMPADVIGDIRGDD